MAGYFVANYTITNPAEYREYLAVVGPTLESAAEAWYESPEYAAIRRLRTDNSEGIGVIAEGR